jgi:hypothetical protein
VQVTDFYALSVCCAHNEAGCKKGKQVLHGVRCICQ